MESQKNSINLSNYLLKMREYSLLSSKATFWFGGILSLIEEKHKNDVNDDININEKIEIIKIISKVVASIANFYEQQRPNSIFKLLNFTEWLFDQLEDNKQYGVIISKVNYLNILSIYAIKTRQYAYAHNIFNEILDIFNSKVIDNTNEFFLAFFNNYLTFIRKSNKKMTSKMMQIQNLLKDSFLKYFTKIMVFDQNSTQQSFRQSLNLLTAIYKQNQSMFTKYEKDINSLILHCYQPLMKTKKKIPQDMISFIFKQKVKKQINFRITFNEDEVKFYSAHKPKFAQSLVVRRHQEDVEPEKKLSKIEAMLQQSIEMLNQQKITSARYVNLQNASLKLNETLNLSTIQTTITTNKANEAQTKMQTLQPLPRSYTKRRQVQVVRPIKPIPKIVRFKTTIFKIRSIFIQINEDGILLSDYTKQNKRYVQWNTLSMIIDRIDLHFPFEEFLKVPLENYYDFVRIISFYLTKNDDKQICLFPKPLPLLQVNEIIKLYKQEGKYMKLALMNHYDTEKFIGIMDCYLSQFSQFFKYLNENEYLFVLNEKIMKGSNSYDREQSIYLIDYLKRKRETTVAQLSNQLHSQHLEYALEQRNTIYKCLFLLKNNLQIYVKIIDNIKFGISFEDYVIQVKIDNINTFGNETFYLSSEKSIRSSNEKKIDRTIEIPIEKLTNYFPHFNMGVKDYLSFYSRTIIDMLNNFDQYVQQPNLGGLSFEVKVHASRSEMIEYGKYYSVVSVELVGSKDRIWAMIVRFYDVAYVSQKITVMMNPYHEFLQCLISASGQEKGEIMKHLLINQSVKDTYNWVKKSNKLEKRINIFQYLYANQLI